jgi:hypothetical protein
MRISDFIGQPGKLLLCLIGLIFGLVCLVSGIRKQRKSFIWLYGFGDLIKNPTFNIFYGIFVTAIFLLALLFHFRIL